jgi:hypothetical protein
MHPIVWKAIEMELNLKKVKRKEGLVDEYNSR